MRRAAFSEPTAGELVDKINTATESLDELFTALLDISRLDAGVVEPQRRATSLRALLERVLNELHPEASMKGLTLRLRTRDVWVNSDPVMLERVVRNLVSNALRYTERGACSLACACATTTRR